MTLRLLSGLTLVTAATALSLAAPVSAGISKNTGIPEGRTLLIGGDTPRGVDIDGQNRSGVAVEMLVKRTNADGTEERRVIRTLRPRERFMQYIRKDEALVFRNASTDERATIYWHISGYSKQANPRIE